jgi:hypothetical protein
MDFLQSNWAKYGMYYGLSSILISLWSFYVSPINIWIQALIGFIIMCVFFYLAAKAEKMENEGALSYGHALKTMLLTGVVGVAISTLFTLILTNLIDPSVTEKLTQMAVEASKSMLEKFNLPEDKLAEAMEKVEEEAANAFTPVNQLFSAVKACFFMLIVAAIMSIFVKKDADPNQFNVNDIGAE